MPLLAPSVRRTAGVLATITAVGLTVPACSTVDSGDLRTGGMEAHIVVAARAESIDVTVDLDAGGLTSVKLQEPDRLIASTPTASEQLTLDSFLGRHVYGARLTGDYQPGTEVAVELQRGLENRSATSTVSLPPQLRVTSPADGSRAPRSHDLRLDVDTAAGPIEVRWEGACVSSGSRSFNEGEPVIIPAGLVTVPAPPASPPPGQQLPPEMCTVTWTVARIVRGSFSEEFDSGRIEARREVSLALESAP